MQDKKTNKLFDKNNHNIDFSEMLKEQIKKKEKRTALRISDEENQKLELLKKKYNIGSTGQLIRNMINVFYVADFKSEIKKKA